jgi:hypothetical protein
MSGALSQVFGGGLINAAMSVASIAFPPLGIATSLCNVVAGAVGEAVNGAAQQLCKEAGMPKFLADMIGGVVGKVLDQVTHPNDPACEQHCQGNDGVKNWKSDFVQDLMKGIIDRVKEEMSPNKPGGAGKKGGGGGSWLEAIAKALGAAAGEKAAKMVELSNKISDLSAEGANITGTDDAAKKAQADNAAKMTEANAELSGVSKMFSLMQETLNTTVKSIGEGLSTVARKQ